MNYASTWEKRLPNLTTLMHVSRLQAQKMGPDLIENAFPQIMTYYCSYFDM